MKQLLLLITLFFCSNIFAQSTNLDRERFHVSYVELPTEPILDNDKRTYSIDINGISIRGLSKVKSSGTLDIKYSFSGTTVRDIKVDKTKHEKKDDDGNVISVSYTYRAKARFSSSATINLVNSITNQSYEKIFGGDTNYSSNEFDSYYKAERHYRVNKYEIKNSERIKHKSTIKSNIGSFLNDKYGYVPYSSKLKFLWILASRKHPEKIKHHEAYNTMKVIFDEMKYDVPMDDIKEKLAPVIAYFNDVIPRYEGKKRKMRKVRYASYYNLANIYYYLDMPEKVKEYGQKIIDNDYDKSDGKRFLKSAAALKNILAINKMSTRHMKVLTEDISHVEEEVVAINTKLELNKAYLITQKSDTILVDIDTNDLKNIGYNLKTVQYNDNGTPVGRSVKKANECKELLFVDGTHFKNIRFKEYSKSAATASTVIIGEATDKLCKVLFESDRLGLYKFNNKELVVLAAGSKKGESTSAMSFVFGLNKKLISIAKGCTTVIKNINAKKYKNSEESLLKFCNDINEYEAAKM